MTRVERSSIQFDDDERNRLHAVWSRSGRHLLLGVTDERYEGGRQIALRTEQVEALGRFLIETNPETPDA